VLRADAVTRVFLNELLLDEADLSIHPRVGDVHWADFSEPKVLIRQGELATLERMVDIRKAILHAEAPTKTVAEQLRCIKEKILEKVTRKL
jgi:NTE family protein